MFFLAFEVKELPWLWASISIMALFLVLIGVYIGGSRTVIKLEINETLFILHFLFNKSVKYQFADVRQYATATFGSGRSGHFHSVVLEFVDGKRFQVAYPVIANYKAFLEFMRSSTFEFYGYIGQNNWRRTNKPLSKKWVVARYEKEFENDVGKRKGLTILYFVGILMLAMNLFLLRYFVIFA